jgi:hypothetical protein
MHIEWTPETLLTQLGYPLDNDALIAQAARVIDATPGFERFARHLLSLQETIKRWDGYLALSNSRDAVKIKTDAVRPEEIEAYRDALHQWSDKYKVTLEPVEHRNTFYILGTV